MPHTQPFWQTWPEETNEYPVGFVNREPTCLTQFQRDCMKKFHSAIQLEQESYLSNHPEILKMMSVLIASTYKLPASHRANFYQSKCFLDLFKELYRVMNELENSKLYEKSQDADIKEVICTNRHFMNEIKYKHLQMLPVDLFKESSPCESATESSSFLSIITSSSTFSSIESVSIPTPTIYDIFYDMILKVVDRAALINYRIYDFLYDTAYVEVMKAVENAMEITVAEVKQDIREMLNFAYYQCNEIIVERAIALAERNWEKRMRKKLKKSLRRQENFKGYETPPSTPKSEVSSHESYKIPPPRPCECSPPIRYNRYPKDRFGVYLPAKQTVEHSSNITTYPSVLYLVEMNEKKAQAQMESQEQAQGAQEQPPDQSQAQNNETQDKTDNETKTKTANEIFK